MHRDAVVGSTPKLSKLDCCAELKGCHLLAAKADSHGTVVAAHMKADTRCCMVWETGGLRQSLLLNGG